MRELDSRLLTSTALHFVQQIARELLVEPSALPWQGRGGRALALSAAGVELVELPRVLGPCLPGHEERRRAVLENAMPGRRLTRLQAPRPRGWRRPHRRRWHSIWPTWPRYGPRNDMK